MNIKIGKNKKKMNTTFSIPIKQFNPYEFPLLTNKNNFDTLELKHIKQND